MADFVAGSHPIDSSGANHCLGTETIVMQLFPLLLNPWNGASKSPESTGSARAVHNPGILAALLVEPGLPMRF